MIQPLKHLLARGNHRLSASLPNLPLDRIAIVRFVGNGVSLGPDEVAVYEDEVDIHLCSEKRSPRMNTGHFLRTKSEPCLDQV